jgi:hypothetical protein
MRNSPVPGITHPMIGSPCALATSALLQSIVASTAATTRRLIIPFTILLLFLNSSEYIEQALPIGWTGEESQDQRSSTDSWLN